MSGTNKEWGVTPGSYPFLVAHVFSFLSHFHLTSVVHVNLSWRDYCQTNQQSFFQNFSITFRWGCRTMAKFADDLFEVQLWCQDGTGDTLAISCSMNKNKICVWAILRPKNGLLLNHLWKTSWVESAWNEWNSMMLRLKKVPGAVSTGTWMRIFPTQRRDAWSQAGRNRGLGLLSFGFLQMSILSDE